ncbi:MAG: hypothetical protein ABSD38_27770 [Syntrophorhabdales bacterium]|jgi:hypothetical protein
MPADFIKNKTEVTRTGLSLGSPLSDSAVSQLYEAGSSLSQELKYILHTEPSLPRRDGYGLSNQAPIKWYDPDWTAALAEMVVSIGRQLGLPPAVIEIHPGDRRNSIDHVFRSAKVIMKSCEDAFSVRPLVMLENRTGQFLSTGRELAEFGRRVWEDNELISHLWIVLDMQQLFTVTRGRFLDEIKEIPREFIRGVHIHRKHQVPRESDEIPWAEVFSWISGIPGDILINPEVHHGTWAAETIEFCKSMMDRVRHKR